MSGINFKKFDDEYLTALTNKGIVKRAYKDLEGLTPAIEQGEDSVTAMFDDVTVTLKESLGDSTCTCPSRSICKHIITAVLYINQNSEDSSTDSTQPVVVTNIEEILAMDDAPLLKLLGATATKSLYADVAHGRLPQIDEGNFISVELADGNKVRLLTPITDSVCSCKSSDICKHKAVAILYYKAYKGVLELKKEDDPKQAQIDIDAVSHFAQRIQEEICHIMTVGLSRISHSIVEHCEKLSLSSHNVGLARHENLFREISAMLESYFLRDVHFSESMLLKKLSYTFELAEKIAVEKDMDKLAELMGTFRDEYIDMKAMSFIPLGDRYIETMSGYAGNAYYFLDEESCKVYSYSDLRPTFYDKSKRSSFAGANLMWSFNMPINTFMEHRFTLNNPKTSADRRISSSNQISGSIGDKLKGDLPITSDVITYDFRTLITMEEQCENDKVAMVMSNTVEDYGYDNIQQIFYMVITDSSGYPMDIVLKNNQQNQKVIRILTTHCMSPKDDTLFIGIVYPESGRLKMVPIEYYQGFVPVDKREQEGGL